jgi:hypothetical protein
VLDNLNTHTIGSLFATYPPDEAWRLKKRLEFHYTPKHASWLNMSRQCLNRRIGDQDILRQEINTWQTQRNAAGIKIEWSFRVPDARNSLAYIPKNSCSDLLVLYHTCDLG